MVPDIVIVAPNGNKAAPSQTKPELIDGSMRRASVAISSCSRSQTANQCDDKVEHAGPERDTEESL